MSETYTYDVFLSYCPTDATWVRGELLTRLERAGLKVCIDHRDFAPGAPKPTETERAVTSSRKTVIATSPIATGRCTVTRWRMMRRWRCWDCWVGRAGLSR